MFGYCDKLLLVTLVPFPNHATQDPIITVWVISVLSLKNATLLQDLTEALEAAMEHMKEMDWEAILEQEDMNREGFEYIDEDEEESFEHWSNSSYS